MTAPLERKSRETLEFHTYPLDVGSFRKTFNRYNRKYNTISVVVCLLICLPFIAHAIAWYLGEAKVDITGFLNLWNAGKSLLLDLGFPHIVFGFVASGIISVGQISFGVIAVGQVSLGIIAVGQASLGIISFGSFLSCGVISIGGYASVGVVAIAYSKSYGLIAISTGWQQFIGAEQFNGGQALGLVAVGRHARGVYALNYGEKGKGVYQFSPEHQDPEAVALFTQWFPKFKGSFVLPS